MFARLLCLVLCTVMISLNSTKGQELTWERTFETETNTVNWMEQLPTGWVLVSGGEGLAAIDCMTGETQWFNADLKSCDRNSFEVVDGLPLASTGFIGASGGTVIFNYYSGEVVFDTDDEEAKVGAHYFLPSLHAVILEYRLNKKNSILLFDYEKNEVLWRATMGDAAGFVKTLSKGFKFLEIDPVVINGGDVLVVENKRLTSFDGGSGQVNWKFDFNKKISTAVYVEKVNHIYAGEKGKLKVIDAATGEDVTPGKLKLGGDFVDAFPNSEDNLILVHNKGFTIFDPASLEFMWKKDFGIYGVDEILEIDGDYYAFSKEDGSSMIARVDRSGKKVWKESVSGQAYYITPLDIGIFYLSTERSNIVQYEDGKEIWKKDVKFKRIPSVDIDTKANDVALFCDKEVYRFSLNDGSVEQLTKDLKLEKYKDQVVRLEVTDDGYFIYSPNHAALVDRKGSITYNNYYVPSLNNNWLGVASDITRLTTGMDIDIEGTIETLDALSEVNTGHTGIRQANTAASEEIVTGMAVQNTQLWTLMRDRYENSQVTKQHYHLLTEDDSHKPIIVSVNKATGQTDQTLSLSAEAPDYIIDEVNQLVMITEDGGDLKCYKMD